MKNIQFIIHGVPDGHQVWGVAHDKYYESFYGLYKDYRKARSVLVVEIRKHGGTMRSLYTFLRTSRVSAENGRTGSYFGMTISADGQYCTDVNSLYHLLEQVYREKMLGRIIATVGEGEKFCVNSFAIQKDYLTEVSEIVKRQIDEFLSGEFDDIDTSFTKSEASKNIYYNLEDVDSETFINATKIFGKVFVSSEYLSKDAQIESLITGNRKVSDHQKDCEAMIKKLSEENNSLKMKIDSLNEQVSLECRKSESFEQNLKSLRIDNENLSTENKRLNNRISELKRFSDVNQLANRLEPDLSELLGLIKEGRSKISTPHINDGKNIGPLQKILTNVLVGLILLVGGVALSRWTSAKDIQSLRNDNESLSQKFKLKSEESKNLKEKLNTLEAAIQGIGRIDVTNFRGGKLEIGKKYDVKILGIDLTGRWKVEGAKCLSQPDSQNLTIIPTGDVEVKLQYTYSNVVVADRTIPVQISL